MTICAPNSRRWSSLAEALNQFDKDGLIYDVIRNYTKQVDDDNRILRVIENSKLYSYADANAEDWMYQFYPTLDHSLPDRIGLLPSEKEVFYLIHFACYNYKHKWGNVLISKLVNSLSLQSITKGDDRQETANYMKEEICKIENVDCSVLSDPTWMHCLEVQNNNASSKYKDWCNDCATLSGCRSLDLWYDGEIDYDYGFIMWIVKNFVSLRNIIDKKLIISSILECLLNPQYSFHHYCAWFESHMQPYLNEIRPFPNSSLTILDVWSYSNGQDIFENCKSEFECDIQNYINSFATYALSQCKFLNGAHDICLKVKEFSKEIESNQDIWSNVDKTLFVDFIPLCSFGTNSLELNRCTEFKKSVTKIGNKKCFTFNESFTPELGTTKGLNFLVNFHHLGTAFDLRQGVEITLHESVAHPDIENTQGKNIKVYPGTAGFFRIATTVLDSTIDFDAMGFESRLCNSNTEYRQINCILDAIAEVAFNSCGCIPAYISNGTNVTCDALDIICYEKLALNATENKNLRKDCYPSCKFIKFSLQEAARSNISNLETLELGKDFANFLQSLILMDTEPNDIDKKLQKTALIRINFDENEVWTVTKDAKITIPDMIGNIGGTLGVFIGFSFLGLLDTIIEMFQYLKRKKWVVEK